MKKVILAATAGFIGLAASANASPISVIQLSQTSASNTVVGANNTLLTGATGATTITIADQTANISQLLGVVTPINGAFVELNAKSTDNAIAVGTGILQHFSGTFCVSALVGCSGTDYLSGNFTDAAFGVSGGSQLSVNIASPPDTLNMISSDIPASKLAAPSSLTFGFTSLSPTPPGLNIDLANNSINPFSASFTMNASASTAVPEPASLALLGAGLLGLGLTSRRLRR